MKDAEKHLKFKDENIIADAEFERKKYLILEENEQISYIKPAKYEISKKQK